MSIEITGGNYRKAAVPAAERKISGQRASEGKKDIPEYDWTDEVHISPEGMRASQAGGAVFSEMKTSARTAEFNETANAVKEQTGNLEINWRAVADPDGSIYSAAYVESIVSQYREAEKSIMEYYVGAHKENLSFENPYNHIYAKYVSNDLFPASPYFRADMPKAERDMAFLQERAILWGSHVNLNDPYAMASSGGVLTMDKVDSIAHKFAQDKLNMLIEQKKQAVIQT